MKRMLAAGYSPIFQLGPCFRRKESGSRHHPEFTMLEWYRQDAELDQLIADTQDLVRDAAEKLTGNQHLTRGPGKKISLDPPWDTMTVDQAFQQFAECHSVESALSDGCFEEILTQQVEPSLGTVRPLILRDFPIEMGGFAEKHNERQDRVQNWELYIDGMEIANACIEVTRHAEQNARFQKAATVRQRQGRPIYAGDNCFEGALLCEDLPSCAGIALGVDRLLMVLSNAERIQDVRPFCE